MPNKTSNKNKNQRKQKPSNRSIVRVDGQGNYWTESIAPFFKKVIPDGTFSEFGGRVGTELGRMAPPGYGGPASRFGNRAGTDLGSRLARFVGFGDYSVESNSLTKTGMAVHPGEAIPSFGVLGHATRIKHREYIGDIVVPATPTAFDSVSYRINPGDPVTFPWLAAIAANYQQYKFEGLVFEYKTLSSDITSGGALGAVIMATNYDVLENAYPDKVRMENSQYAVSAKPSCSQIHTIECDPKASANQLWYVRDSTSSSLTTSDDRFYDLGKFQMATSGLPGTAGQVLGELWASYDVSLYKPELASPPGLSSKIVSGGVISDAAIFGSASVITGTPVSSATASTLTFTRSGEYLIVITLVGTGANACTVGGTATTTNLWSELAAATTSGTFVFRVTATEGQTSVFDATAWTTVTSSITRVTDYPYSLA